MKRQPNGARPRFIVTLSVQGKHATTRKRDVLRDIRLLCGVRMPDEIEITRIQVTHRYPRRKVKGGNT